MPRRRAFPPRRLGPVPPPPPPVVVVEVPIRDRDRWLSLPWKEVYTRAIGQTGALPDATICVRTVDLIHPAPPGRCWLREGDGRRVGETLLARQGEPA